MSQLSVILQESARRETEVITILGLLRQQMEMDGVHSRRRTRMSLKERLGFRGLGCCGATWGFRPTTISVRDDDEELQEQETEFINAGSNPSQGISDPDCLAPTPMNPASSGMNLASALAAERQFREATIVSPSRNDVSITAAGTPLRISLMRLLEESDGGDGEMGIEKLGGGVGSDTVCCVCMVRKKGAAFIPCGHTYCRVCSRELWLNRGSCPLCNRSIIEILDIF